MRRPSSVGVDISDSSIKVLQLDTEGNVVAYGSGSLKEGVVSDGYIHDKALFAEALIEILKNTKPTALFAKQSQLRAVLCLPEAKLFTHHAKLPKDLRNADLEKYISNDAKKIIPFELDDLYWDFHTSEKNGERYATFVGAPKSNVDNYVEALTFANVKPSFIVGELFSLAQAVSGDEVITDNYMIADIGARTTNIGTFAIDTVATMSITVPLGGKALTKALVDTLHITEAEAEVLKREKGVDDAAAESGVPAILKKTLEETLTALREAKTHFETTSGHPVSYLILAGGTALLPGLQKYVADALGIEVRVADPFSKIKNREIIKMDTPEIFFSNVIGLALQSRNERTTSFNLLTQYRYSEDQDRKEVLALRDIQSVDDFKYFLYWHFAIVRDFVRTAYEFISRHFDLRLAMAGLFVVVTIAFLGWVLVTYI